MAIEQIQACAVKQEVVSKGARMHNCAQVFLTRIQAMVCSLLSSSLLGWPSMAIGSMGSTPGHDGVLRARCWCPQVFVGGSETTTEHRAQIYTPSYLQNGKPRPAITSSPSNVGYSAGFSIGFSGVPSLDRIVLNRLAGATHSNHFDQRQVVLDCSDTGNTANCRSPPNSSVAPPGLYQLFVLFQGVPSRANIVNVTSVDTPPPVDENRGSGLPQTGPARTPGSPVSNLVASSVAVGG